MWGIFEDVMWNIVCLTYHCYGSELYYVKQVQTYRGSSVYVGWMRRMLGHDNSLFSGVWDCPWWNPKKVKTTSERDLRNQERVSWCLYRE